MPKRKAWQGHAGEALDTVDQFTVIDCDACRFKHIVPIPTPAELEHTYGHEYYSTTKPLYIERDLEDRDWLNLVYSERYDAFERLLGLKRRRLLDVGSGPGLFLRHGVERGGWKVKGLEPSTQAVAHSHTIGLDVTQAFLNEETAAALGRFDVVHLSEVLEHVPDPLGMVKIAHGLLDPGGLLAVMVPNDYSPIQSALRDGCGFSPWWVAPPHHVNYFDVPSIQRVLKPRFDVVSVDTSFPIDLFLLMGDNYVGNDALGRACHAKRKTMELHLARAGKSGLKQAMYRSLAQLGVGRDVFVIARRRGGRRARRSGGK
ncbi:MAG: class I SAM-dependent methyltransferase [Acidobacteriia bacterium]|nr:class I SAM-dependent methyltransferase [Terriglobia bacterium]